MRLYLDTNILYFLIQEREEISNDVRRLFEDYGNTLYTSTVCVQELIHLCQTEKIKIGKKSDIIQHPTDVFRLLEECDIRIMPIIPKHLQEYANLPLWKEHTDPNDRLIIAQAMSDKVCLVSSDHKFKHYEQYGLDFLFNKR